MNEFPSYLCLTDLLDQNLSAYEYFQTLPPDVQTALRREDGNIGTLDELQARVENLQASGQTGGQSRESSGAAEIWISAAPEEHLRSSMG